MSAQSYLVLNERLEYPYVSGYESGVWPNGWGWYANDPTGTNADTSGMTDAMAHSGKQSLYFTDTQGAGYESIFLKGANANVNTNDTVTFSFWVRSDAVSPYNGSCVFVCSMEFHNTALSGDPTINAVTDFVSPQQMSTNGWTKFSMSGSPAALANQLMFVIKSSNYTGTNYISSGGTMYFDDLQAHVAYGDSNPSNILINPSFEAGSAGWTLIHPEGDGGNIFQNLSPEDGNLVYKCWGTGVATNIQSIVQVQSAAAGDTYVASGFGRNGDSGDTISAPSQFWLEVDFLGATTNVLSSYESSRLGSTANTASWTKLNITNQVNPATRAVIGTANNLVAPVGTVKVRFSAMYSQNTNSGGSVQFDNMSLIETNGKIPPMIANVNPDGTLLLNNAANGFSFNTLSAVTNIDANGVKLVLNGVNVSSDLIITGSGSNDLSVVYPALQSNVQYTAVIDVTDQGGTSSTRTVNFDTYSTANPSWEGEDYDYGSGQYINHPAPLASAYTPSYQNLMGTPGVDYYESGAWGGDSTLRESYGVGPGISGCFDVNRYYDLDAGCQDYYIGWFNGGITNGDWVNYTRSIPAGSYNVVCRLRSTGGVAVGQLAQVTSGAGTVNQTTNVLGTVSVDSIGMGNWSYGTVMGTNDAPVTLTYTNASNLVTYRVSGSSNINYNFFMLVPIMPKVAVQLFVTRLNGQTVISFPSQTGVSYTLQYKDSLRDTNWVSLPETVIGDNNVESITDTNANVDRRFYRVIIQ